MKKLALLAFAAALGLIAGGLASAQEVKPEVIAKIEKALPESAPAKPKQARKVLVYTRANGFVHGSIPIGAKALELMGKKTGAYEVAKVTDDPAVFDGDLAQYDAIVLVSTTGDFLLPKDFGKLPEDQKKAAKAAEPNRKQALLKYVESGKGLMGIHAASDAYYGWPEYGDLIGGYFQNHPYGKINIRVDDPDSPINAQFNGQNFEFSDEIYVFKPKPFSRDRLRVLLSVDVEKSGITNQAREDKDYAVAWIRGHGQGRVFYTLLGHRDETYFNPVSMKYFLAGLQYALGDLQADATPGLKAK